MKRIIVLLAIAIFLMPLIGQAHTTLSSSTPAEGSIVDEPLEEVVLTFGTVIEQGSSMTLESENASYEFNEIVVSDSVMTGTITEELPNTDYTVRWEIIGADGHAIEGEVAFTLNIDSAEDEITPEETQETETEMSEPAIEEVPVEEEKAVQTSEDKGNPMITVFLVLALLVIAFIAYRLLKRKKN